MWVHTQIDVQGEEEAKEWEAAFDVNVPTPESEGAMSASSRKPTPIPIYSIHSSPFNPYANP